MSRYRVDEENRSVWRHVALRVWVKDVCAVQGVTRAELHTYRADDARCDEGAEENGNVSRISWSLLGNI